MKNIKDKLEALEKENQELLNRNKLLEVKLEKVYNTITYSLGDALIQSTKSWDGFKKLAPSLLELYRRSKRLRSLNSGANNNQDYSFQVNYNIHDINVCKLDSFDVNERLQLTAKANKLNIACIMDEFTYSSFDKEASFLQLSREHWLSQLEQHQPDLLFIESAWRGLNGEWHNAVGKNVDELLDILQWCKDHDVPTIFWNKEDPVHFNTFINTAKLFDYVFTTDIDCLPHYKEQLGHDRVFWLPFACQPRVQNPIELYNRNNAFCFAGAYYLRYPDRTRDLEEFVQSIIQDNKLVIYDRNYYQNDPNYQFPKRYSPLIKGNLQFEQINEAYKGYDYGINLNSVKQSQSMFARRVFELLASNSIVVSNFSKGLRNLFGDLVISTDNGSQLAKLLQNLTIDDNLLKKKLLGLRNVMLNHTYESRLNFVTKLVFGKEVEYFPKVMILAVVENVSFIEIVKSFLESQSYKSVEVGIFISGSQEYILLKNSMVESVSELEFMGKVGLSEYVALFHPANFYASEYLLDLLLATKYSSSNILGKSSYFILKDHQISHVSDSLEYQSSNNIVLSSALIKTKYFKDNFVLKNIENMNDIFVSGLSLDRFDFCINGNNSSFNKPDFSSITVTSDKRSRFSSMLDFSFLKKQEEDESIKKFSADYLHNQVFLNMGRGSVKVALIDDEYTISSTLAEGTHEYLYAKNKLELAEFNILDNSLLGFFEVSSSLDIQLVFLFLDEKDNRISHSIEFANRSFNVPIPNGTSKIQLGYRISGTGSSVIQSLYFGGWKSKDVIPYGANDYLVLTNIYPSYNNLYRNGFVHSRVKEYAQNGLSVDVFCLPHNYKGSIQHTEFENVDVMTGTATHLDNLLKYNKYKKVLVHFLDQQMWDVLKNYIDDIEVCVWVHGSEVQPWWRREYNYTTEAQLTLAKKESDVRLYFWRSILSDMPDNLHLVFVSQYFANEVMEDLELVIADNKYDIIHNPINTKIFDFIPKDISQRKRILSIRPYASAKYANDLSVKAIKNLTQYPWFKDLDIKLIGDGVLFDEILDPLRKYPNVIIERGFLAQADIAKLHKEYGIFLCPTRMDAQGVSKDEAMSSGLVVVTNAVTAIPEFCNEDCAIMAGDNDYLGMAEGIKELVESPEKFTRLSEASAARVRSQTSSDIIIEKELNLIKNSSDLK